MQRIAQRLTFYLFIFLIVQSLLISNVSARNYILQTSSTLEITSEVNQTISIDPIGIPTTFELTIRYTYGRLARPEGFPLPSNKVPTMINLTIEEKPQWCIVSMDRGSFETPPIKTFLFKNNETILFTTNITLSSINETIPSSIEDTILFKVESEVNGNIASASSNFEVVISPKTLYNYEYLLKSSSTIDLFYNEEANLIIDFTNRGNEKINVNISAINPSEIVTIHINNEIYSNEFSLDLDEDKSVKILVHSISSDTINQSINQILQLDFYDIDNQLLSELSDQINLQINLNAPHIEKEEGESNFILSLIIGIVIILLIAPFVFLYQRYKKSK